MQVVPGRSPAGHLEVDIAHPEEELDLTCPRILQRQYAVTQVLDTYNAKHERSRS